MNANELMSSPPVSIGLEATVADAARCMLDKNVSCLPVVDGEGKVVGILTHTDFGLHPRFRPLVDNLYTLLGTSVSPRHIAEVSQRVGSKLIKEVMPRRVFTVEGDTPIEKVVELMLRQGIHRIPVTEDGRLVGIITRHDFLKLIAGG